MGAFLSAATHAPLTSVLMIFEMTENYGVVVPLMLACVLGYYVSRVLRPQSIYASGNPGFAHAPALTIAADLVRSDSATVRPGQSLRELEDAFLRHRWPHVYVLDDDRRFLGAIAMHDLAPLVKNPPPEGTPWPDALLRADYPRVHESTPIWQVMETFATHPGERLPVLDEQGRLKGHVTKTDLVLMFRDQLAVS
jgi:CIC family chloride channel protein